MNKVDPDPLDAAAVVLAAEAKAAAENVHESAFVVADQNAFDVFVIISKSFWLSSSSSFLCDDDFVRLSHSSIIDCMVPLVCVPVPLCCTGSRTGGVRSMNNNVSFFSSIILFFSSSEDDFEVSLSLSLSLSSLPNLLLFDNF